MIDDALLRCLEEMPDLLRQIADALTEPQRRVRPAAGGFCLVEHAWHLADLEREGYGVRITRLLAEEHPELSDFPGNRIARERRYEADDLDLALALFVRARRRNLQCVRRLDETALSRPGTQEGVGAVSMADMPRMMAVHDRGHVGELATLVAEIAPTASVLPLLRRRAAAPPPSAPEAPTSRPVAA